MFKDRAIFLPKVYANGLNQTKAVQIKPFYDTNGETVSALLYVKGEPTATATVASVSGVPKRSSLQLDLNLTGVPAGVYTVKVLVSSIGVLAKGILEIKG
jgi:hypothetical protein